MKPSIEMSRRRLLAMAGASAGATLLTSHTLLSEGLRSLSTEKLMRFASVGSNTSFASLKQINAGLLNLATLSIPATHVHLDTKRWYR